MLEKEFKPDVLYGKIIHYYIDKKGYNKSKANAIAQHIVQKETQRRVCRTKKCGHFAHDHIRNTGVCLVNNCSCSVFTNMTKRKPLDAVQVNDAISPIAVLEKNMISAGTHSG